MSTKRKYKHHSFDLNALRNAVKEVFSWRALGIKLGFEGSHNTIYTKVRRLCTQNNIDFSHFTGQGHNRGKTFINKRTDIQLYLNNQKFINSHKLKERLIQEGIKQYHCEVCGLDAWRGKPIPIQLHHLDGNGRNNSLENLQIICPNCHAQTPNYCGKNVRNHKTKAARISDEHLLSIVPECTCPAQVLRRAGLSLAQGHYERLSGLLQKNQNVQYLKKNDVIDIAIPLSEEEISLDAKSGKTHKTRHSPKDVDWRRLPKIEQRKVKNRPSKEELEKLIWTKSMKQLAKDFGITDNPLRKWCKTYGITNLPPRRYWARRRAGWSHEEALEPVKPKQLQKRFTDQQVVEILEALEKPYWGLIRGLARKYGVHNHAILDIRDGKTYKHVPRKTGPATESLARDLTDEGRLA